MFADLDDTIRELLIKHVPIDPNEIEIAFDTPDREWSSRLTKPAINCFLYDVRENMKLRAAGWDMKRGANNTASKQRGPLRVDATYQVTTWARMPEDEHRLLWRVLTTLVRTTPIPQDLLRGSLLEIPTNIPTSVMQPEQMPSNFADLWQGLDNKVRPGLTYVVTLTLDPAMVFTSPIVLHTPQIGLQQVTPGGAAASLRVNGRVMDKENPSQGLSGAMVMIEQTGARAITDEEGRFQVAASGRGAITLVVRAAGRSEVKIATAVPAPDQEIEI